MNTLKVIQSDIAPKAEAKRLFFNRHPVAAIARELKIPATTIYTWVENEAWAQIETEDKIAFIIETRLIHLLSKESFTGEDKQTIDFLQRQLESVRKTKAKFQYDLIDNGAKAERKEKREARAAKSGKNSATPEQLEKLKKIFDGLLFDYQKTWYKNLNQRNRFILKSRQIGATYYYSLEALIDAFETGRNKIFISASKAQAYIFRSYMIKFAAQADITLKGGDVITLENGAELHFLGTNYKTAQGLNGDLYLDEVFWIYGFAELYKVASGMSSHKKWRRTLMSSASTITHEAYGLWSGQSKKKNINISHGHLKDGALDVDRQWRHMVTILDAIEGGCDLFDLEELKDEYSEADFNNLFMCEFIDDTFSVFSLMTMMRCHVDSWLAWTDIKPFNKRPYTGKVWIGYDPNGGGEVSATSDNAAVAVLTEPKNHDDKFRILEIFQFKNGQDYEAQSDYILKLCDKYNVSHIGLDGNGVGAGVAEIIKKAKPAITTVLKYSRESKNNMVMKAKNTIDKGRLEYDAGLNVIAQSFMAIKFVDGCYKTDRLAAIGHGDIAWAIMNAIINEPIDRNAKGKSRFEVI